MPDHLQLCFKKHFHVDVFLGNLQSFSRNYSQDQVEHIYCYSFEFLHIILCFHFFISNINKLKICRGIFKDLSNIYGAAFSKSS